MPITIPGGDAGPITEAYLINLRAERSPSILDDFLPPILEEIFLDIPEFIVFPYMPESFTETKSAEYANVNILGRSEPVLGYSHSGPRIFDIKLDFVADGGGDDPISDALPGDISGRMSPYLQVIRPLWLIRSWLYPKYIDQGSLPNVPPTILFVVGSWLSQKCVLTKYSITYHAPWGRVPGSSQLEVPLIPGDTFNLLDLTNFLKDSVIPFWAEVHLTLQEVAPNIKGAPFDHTQVMHGWDRTLGGLSRGPLS